jgi:membrane protease YdiL (CAAX protease family)
MISLTVALVGVAVTAALWSFNRQSSPYSHYILGNIMGLFWVPMLTIVFLFREGPEKFGFTLGFDKKGIWPAVGIMFGVLMAVILVFRVFRWPEFQAYYPIFRHFSDYSGVFGRSDVSPFAIDYGAAIFALASYGMYLFFWEFFFRGYLLQGLERSIGLWAVLLQAVAFGLLHIGKPPVEVFSSFAAGIILGILALRAKSFIPGFVLHWGVSLCFDLLVIAGRR